jgi:hypothetical protein
MSASDPRKTLRLDTTAVSVYGLKNVFAAIRAEILERGSLRAWARAHDLSAAYVSDVLNCRRDPGPSILAAIRYGKHETRTITYIRSSDDV